MRFTRGSKFRIQIIILITVLFLLGLFIHIQHEENNVEIENIFKEEHIEDHIISSRTALPSIESIPNESIPSEPTNCAYKV